MLASSLIERAEREQCDASVPRWEALACVGNVERGIGDRLKTRLHVLGAFATCKRTEAVCARHDFETLLNARARELSSTR